MLGNPGVTTENAYFRKKAENKLSIHHPPRLEKSQVFKPKGENNTEKKLIQNMPWSHFSNSSKIKQNKKTHEVRTQPYSPSPGFLPREPGHRCTQSGMWMFTAALGTTATEQQQPRCPSRDEWTSPVWTTVTRSSIQPQKGTKHGSMLENITPSKSSQPQATILRMTPLMCPEQAKDRQIHLWWQKSGERLLWKAEEGTEWGRT